MDARVWWTVLGLGCGSTPTSGPAGQGDERLALRVMPIDARATGWVAALTRRAPHARLDGCRLRARPEPTSSDAPVTVQLGAHPVDEGAGWVAVGTDVRWRSVDAWRVGHWGRVARDLGRVDGDLQVAAVDVGFWGDATVRWTGDHSGDGVAVEVPTTLGTIRCAADGDTVVVAPWVKRAQDGDAVLVSVHEGRQTMPDGTVVVLHTELAVPVDLWTHAAFTHAPSGFVSHDRPTRPGGSGASKRNRAAGA